MKANKEKFPPLLVSKDLLNPFKARDPSLIVVNLLSTVLIFTANCVLVLLQVCEDQLEWLIPSLFYFAVEFGTTYSLIFWQGNIHGTTIL